MIGAGRGNPLSLLLMCALALLSGACRKKAESGPSPRYAVLRFENLSGNPDLDWVGRAVSESLPASLAGTLGGPVLDSAAISRLAATLGPRPLTAPGDSSERTEALAAGANRLISGYVEGTGGQVMISAVEEDVASGKSLRMVTASGPSAIAAMERLARDFSQQAHPLPTTNVGALRAYAIAYESPAGAKREFLDQSIGLDPDFGEAWVALAGLEAVSGNRAAAEAVLERARAHKIDARSRANLDVGEANLKGDRQAIIAALRKVVALGPGDLVLLRSLAEAETTAGDFKPAISDWKKVTDALPNDAVAWNSLGYGRSYAGDYTGALAALREYERLRPKDANPTDSIGDLNYSFGKFAAAAGNYVEADKKQPGFEKFGDLYKAAWAKFRAGDKAGAAALFSQFRAQREKSRDQVIGLLEADWLYRTGRQQEAVSSLRKLISETRPPSVIAGAYAQLTVWELLQGDRAQAAKDSAAIGPTTSSAPVFMARFAALPSAPVSEWVARAQKLVPPQLAPLRNLTLGYALLLDGKRAAATQVWGEIVKSTSAIDFFSRAIYARLQGKPIERPLLQDANSLNQFAALVDRI